MRAATMKLPEITRVTVDDLPELKRISGPQEPHYFERNMELQALGERILWTARYGGAPAGYCILNWAPRYKPFMMHNIPEVQDLFVAPDFRKRGIGDALVANCEAEAKAQGHKTMGIGVGLTRSYGAAQRLYIRRGYIPDGNGLCYDRESVASGEFRAIDDDLCLMLTKSLA